MPSRVRAILGVALILAPLALLGVACSRSPEQTLLTQFFRAARTRDNATVAMMSAVDFDPREHGVVEDFEIVSISPETRAPTNLAQLVEAQQAAAAAETELRKLRFDFESANRPALEAIAKLEREENARLTPQQEKLKAEWDKYREGVVERARQTSAAKQALTNAIGPVEASLSQPGASTFDPAKFTGELVTRQVTINAEVEKDGQTSQKTIVVTIQHAEGTYDGQQRVGRPIITAIQVS